MDLTFQVPMQYCSLQHQTLLLSPVPFTTGCCFCFGSIPSFFLKLFLHCSPLAYWAPTNLGSSTFSVLYLFAFSYCSWGSQGKNTEVVCHSLLHWTTFVRTPHRDPIIIPIPTYYLGRKMLFFSFQYSPWNILTSTYWKHVTDTELRTGSTKNQIQSLSLKSF